MADFATDRFFFQPPHVAFSACFFGGEGYGIMPFDWALRIARRNSPGRNLLFPLIGRWALVEQSDCAGKITQTFPDGKTIGEAAQYVGAY